LNLEGFCYNKGKDKSKPRGEEMDIAILRKLISKGLRAQFKL